MKKNFTILKTFALVAGMLLTSNAAMAGDGTKANPYTVAELNAQKDALAASGETVWVKADLKGLGEDGTKTENATVENVKQMAGLFGDDTGTFVAYSWQILGELALSDLTNTKDLLIALTYGTTGHPYGNTASPQYASNYEPTDAHFSLAEVHGALSLNINELMGYHINSSYIVPKDVIAVKVSAGYSTKQDPPAYVNYTNFDGAENTFVTPKNAALILMANKGTHDFVLSAALNEQTISNGNALNPGTQAGVNAGATKNRTALAFINNDFQTGFQKNSDENYTVTLQKKSDVFLLVNSLETNFYGNYAWETPEKDWISWGGGKYSDIHPQTQAAEAIFNFADPNFRENIGTAMTDTKGYIYNETFTVENVTLQITGGSAPSRIYVDAGRGQCLVTYKEYTTLTFKAPENYAITKIEFTAAGNSNINNFTATSGTIEGMIWTGNAEGVRFTQGGTSYLANAIVTLAPKGTETVALPAIEYTPCANIAAFNALEAGTYAKVTLTDAEVIGKSADGYSTVWIQDATGGCWMQYTSLNDKLAEKTKINGTIYAVARLNAGNVQMKEAEATLTSDITATDISDYTIIEGTLAAVNVAANKNKVVKISGATLEETSATAGTLTQGDATLAVNNGSATANQMLHKISEWAKDTKLENITIVGILVGKSSTENQLLPISITATPQATEATFNFADPNFRENIGTAMADTKGFIYNEAFNAENVTLQITAGSAPSRIYVDNNRGQCLVTYTQYTTLTFKAPTGYAITKIEFTAAGSSNINKLTPSSGAIAGMIWTGNAEGVRFTQGGTSYLSNAIVTLAEKTGETTTLPAIEYTACANIAAFNALEAGTYAKVTLTDAEVIGKSADGYSTVWIQDATGGCWMQYTTLNDKLNEKTKINGTVYVVSRATSGNVQMKEAEATLTSDITATDISDYTIIEGTLAAVNVPANLNKVVKISDATLEETSATAGKLTQGDATINVNNGTETANQQLHKISEWAKDTRLEHITIVAILVATSATDATKNQLLPISITSATGINGITTNDENGENVVIYNLMGVRQNSLKKGINIVNGKKIIVR